MEFEGKNLKQERTIEDTYNTHISSLQDDLLTDKSKKDFKQPNRKQEDWQTQGKCWSQLLPMKGKQELLIWNMQSQTSGSTPQALYCIP